jgi:hypothetical protein
VFLHWSFHHQIGQGDRLCVRHQLYGPCSDLLCRQSNVHGEKHHCFCVCDDLGASSGSLLVCSRGEGGKRRQIRRDERQGALLCVVLPLFFYFFIILFFFLQFFKFLAFWVLQMITVWAIAIPYTVMFAAPVSPGIGWQDILGIILWGIGFLIEAIRFRCCVWLVICLTHFVFAATSKSFLSRIPLETRLFKKLSFCFSCLFLEQNVHDWAVAIQPTSQLLWRSSLLVGNLVDGHFHVWIQQFSLLYRETNVFAVLCCFDVGIGFFSLVRDDHLAVSLRNSDVGRTMEQKVWKG